jgi:predicted Rossmann fold flavoprotein
MVGMRVVVVGGGAAGMMAAWRAACLGHRVLLLEANGRLGVKLRISGGGKCNITHEGTVAQLLQAFPRAQGRFLRPALHAFGNREVLELLRKEGVDTFARPNGRVFPLDRPGSAGAVTAAFEALVRRVGVEVRLGTRVAALVGARPRLEALALENGAQVPGDLFILATGGASYPRTGTRGEILAGLARLGVPTTPWFPALAPIPLAAPRPGWEGVALREGTLELRAERDGKVLERFSGDILFTRDGISGPAALELSRPAEAARRTGAAWLDYVLDPREGELDQDLQTEQRAHPHLALRTWLSRRLPERLCAPALEELGVPPDQRLQDLPRAGRKAVIALLRAFPLGRPAAVDLERGEVSAGGVLLAGVDAATMAVRDWDNLRVCGELLDIDGPVGGYNLQAAFSTGYAAGNLEA